MDFLRVLYTQTAYFVNSWKMNTKKPRKRSLGAFLLRDWIELEETVDTLNQIVA